MMITENVMSHLPLEVLIFSKDRACQLETLLRSMGRFFNIDNRSTVLYTASTADYSRAYEIVSGNNPGVRFIKENHFKEDLVGSLQPAAHEQRFVMFLVDDIVFTRSYNGGENLETFAENNEILTVSLRLGERVTYCYPRDIDTIPHDFSESNMWRWQEAHTGYWNYPMSLDGHIFRANDIVGLIKRLAFNNPNTLEAALANSGIQKPMMLAEKEPYLVNLALNCVQSVFISPHGTITTEQLNREFLAGERIDIEPIIRGQYSSCHITPDIHFLSGKSIA